MDPKSASTRTGEIPRFGVSTEAIPSASSADIHHDYKQKKRRGRTDNDQKNNMAGHRENEDGKWKEKEHDDDVEYGKPSVSSCCITHRFRKHDWQTETGDRIPQQDAGYVETKMAECDLKSRFELVI